MIICPKCNQSNKDSSVFCFKCGSKLVSGSAIFAGAIKNEDEAVKGTLQLPEEPSPKERTLQNGRYLLKSELGAGGMGKIYLAKDLRMESEVVVKEMLPIAATKEEKEYFEKRFQEEAKLLFTLKHSGLPRVTDYFEESENLYITMEYIEGNNLEKVVRERQDRRITPEEFRTWMTKTIDILKYLHSQDPPVIHRDIKPSNLMLTPRGDIVLVDFGVARTAGLHTKTKTSVGTFGFASPEHFSGRYTLSSDIYSLGATFHYLLSGDNPQEREAFDYPPISKYRGDLPDDLQAVLKKMVEMQRKNRYQDVEELEKDFNQCLTEKKEKAPEKPRVEIPDFLVNKRAEAPGVIPPRPSEDIPARPMEKAPARKQLKKEAATKKISTGKLALMFVLALLMGTGTFFTVKGLFFSHRDKNSSKKTALKKVSVTTSGEHHPDAKWTEMPESDLNKPLIVPDKKEIPDPLPTPEKGGDIPKPPPAQPENIPPGKNSFSIETKAIVDKGEKYEVDIKYPVMTENPNREIQDNFNSIVTGFVESRRNDFVKEAHKEAGSDQMGMTFSLSYAFEVEYESGSLISLILNGNSFLGGAHGNDEYYSLAYDVNGGRKLEMGDLFVANSGYLRRISEFCVQHLKDRLVKDGSSDDKWIETGAAPDPANYKFFTLNRDEIVILFPQYQVASYAAGPQKVGIPYKNLEDIIDRDGPLGEFMK